MRTKLIRIKLVKTKLVQTKLKHLLLVGLANITSGIFFGAGALGRHKLRLIFRQGAPAAGARC